MWHKQSANARPAVAPRKRHSMTFSYTGAQQYFVVPTGVTHVTVHAYGGSSGTGPSNSSHGKGGFNGGGNGI